MYLYITYIPYIPYIPDVPCIPYVPYILYMPYVIEIQIHSGFEIEDFVETHICKLCVTLRARVLRVVCPHQGYRSATPLETTV